MKGEFIEQHICREAARGVGIGGQRGNLAAAGQFDFKGADVGVKRRLEFPEPGLHGAQMQFDALVHGLSRLAFAARENHPAGASTFGFGAGGVNGNFECAGKGFPTLARDHGDLEAGIVCDPAALVGVERERGPDHFAGVGKVIRGHTRLSSLAPARRRAPRRFCPVRRGVLFARRAIRAGRALRPWPGILLG